MKISCKVMKKSWKSLQMFSVQLSGNPVHPLCHLSPNRLFWAYKASFSCSTPIISVCFGHIWIIVIWCYIPAICFFCPPHPPNTLTVCSRYSEVWICGNLSHRAPRARLHNSGGSARCRLSAQVPAGGENAALQRTFVCHLCELSRVLWTFFIFLNSNNDGKQHEIIKNYPNYFGFSPERQCRAQWHHQHQRQHSDPGPHLHRLLVRGQRRERALQKEAANPHPWGDYRGHCVDRHLVRHVSVQRLQGGCGGDDTHGVGLWRDVGKIPGIRFSIFTL